jgi:outer membrane beta-barrel protein
MRSSRPLPSRGPRAVASCRPQLAPRATAQVSRRRAAGATLRPSPSTVGVGFAALCLVAIGLAPARADAQDARGYSSTAVQNRIHGGDYEITLYGGILPLDAFEKGATLGGAFAIHFSELIGWEVANYIHSFTFDTDLRDQLRAFELSPTPFEVAQDIILTNLLIKPVYWKGAFLNQDLIYGEFMFVVGGGYAFFTQSNRFTIDVGLINRLYLTEWLSLKLDTRYLAFFRNSVFDFDIQDEVWISLGVSVHF